MHRQNVQTEQERPEAKFEPRTFLLIPPPTSPILTFCFQFHLVIPGDEQRNISRCRKSPARFTWEVLGSQQVRFPTNQRMMRFVSKAGGDNEEDSDGEMLQRICLSGG